MVAAHRPSRFVGATWSNFQPSLGLPPIQSNRSAGSALARALVNARLVESAECVLRGNAEVVDVLDLIDHEAASAQGLFAVYVCSHGLYPFTAPYRLATNRTKH